MLLPKDVRARLLENTGFFSSKCAYKYGSGMFLVENRRIEARSRPMLKRDRLRIRSELLILGLRHHRADGPEGNDEAVGDKNNDQGQ